MTVAVIFTSTRTEGDDEAYAAAATRMVELAAGQPGYEGIESVRDPVTRRGITVSYWTDEAASRAWREVAEHLLAQRLGVERWYDAYDLRVATVTRDHSFRRTGP